MQAKLGYGKLKGLFPPSMSVVIIKVYLKAAPKNFSKYPPQKE